MVSIYVDDHGRVTGMNRSDLSGNSGWIVLDEADVEAQTGATVDGLMDGLTNPDGVPLYRLADGIVQLRTTAEIEQDTPVKVVQVSPDERLETVEHRVDDIATQNDEIILAVADLIGGAVL